MSAFKEREAVKAMYPKAMYPKAMYPKAKGWAKRVDRMSDAQVIAIYKKRQQKEKK